MSAPEFTLDNALGGKTSLSDYSGKPVLLFFHMAVG
ncbi:MAG: redoxin domain-containing protein [Chloroflexi bacterium]|nr:redoxin domain-containing protein [Chloroflexota bacterium]MBT3669781.1 redoxin domain-containing protein [Chloroflexota bacterium]MBT4002260.1 redoxin domain-containing protein [Chloroflexota bacterium]MBT4305261.1 redoxin domain-containing protein [Chloroflexota bacterium]MBT4534816.1 redoxin domain-containing protein [Chloroflexota bacterium]